MEIGSGKIAGYIRKGIIRLQGRSLWRHHRRVRIASCRLRSQSHGRAIRSSRQYGFVCPQDKGTGRLNDEEAFLFQWNDSVEGEDCLRVNVWTPGVNDNQQRPVMVWLHGGGFEAGSGNDIPAFDGENLARHGDVVVVTLNHRLNVLGFLDLSKYGDQYAQSGNVGMLDIVAALEWVRDNIAVLGGDPATGDDLRPVRRRGEGRYAHGHARREGVVPSGGRGERLVLLHQYAGQVARTGGPRPVRARG